MKIRKEVVVRTAVAVLSVSSLIAFFRAPYTDVEEYDKLCPPESNTVFIDCDTSSKHLMITYPYDTIFEFMSIDDNMDLIVYDSDVLTDKEARVLYYKNNK